MSMKKLGYDAYLSEHRELCAFCLNPICRNLQVPPSVEKSINLLNDGALGVANDC